MLKSKLEYMWGGWVSLFSLQVYDCNVIPSQEHFSIQKLLQNEHLLVWNP